MYVRVCLWECGWVSARALEPGRKGGRHFSVTSSNVTEVRRTHSVTSQESASLCLFHAGCLFVSFEAVSIRPDVKKRNETRAEGGKENGRSKERVIEWTKEGEVSTNGGRTLRSIAPPLSVQSGSAFADATMSLRVGRIFCVFCVRPSHITRYKNLFWTAPRDRWFRVTLSS